MTSIYPSSEVVLVLHSSEHHVSVMRVAYGLKQPATNRRADYGSTILSDSTYKDSIKDELKLEAPMASSLRSQLLNVENLDGLQYFSRLFLPVTIEMKKIWSFYEVREMSISVRAESHGGRRRGIMEVKAPVGTSVARSSP